jgi:WhiB family redox-sensing transcriptional regulator
MTTLGRNSFETLPNFHKGDDWRDRAACLQEDPEQFFPEGKDLQATLETNRAKTVCRGCAVVAACLKFALETDQDFGVWGGMSEEERRALKRRNAGNALNRRT